MAAMSQKIFDIYIGATGTGKSTLIGTRDGGVTQGSAGWESVTKNCSITRDKSDSSLWMLDTQGICDSKADETGDIDSFIQGQIFKKMKQKGGKYIRVIWTIDSAARSKVHLKRLARFIHSLGEPEGAAKVNDVWKSVVIVCKEGSRKRQCEGAIGAACHAMKSSRYSYRYKRGHERTILTTNLTILDTLDKDDRDLKSAKRMDKYERSAEGLIWMKEVGDWQRSLLRNVEPVQVVFQHRHCRKCGQSGDPREFDKYCHSSFQHRGHIVKIPGATRYYHSGHWSECNGATKAFASIHPGGWIAQAFSSNVRAQLWGHWSCCMNRNSGSNGCKSWTESHDEYEYCECPSGRLSSDCPDPGCRDCGQRKGSKRYHGARCRGSHQWW